MVPTKLSNSSYSVVRHLFEIKEDLIMEETKKRQRGEGSIFHNGDTPVWSIKYLRGEAFPSGKAAIRLIAQSQSVC